MKRIVIMILVISLCFPAFSGCGRSDVEYASYSSENLGATYPDDPDADAIKEMLLPREALFAYKLKRSEDGIGFVQTVYIWQNLLCRELRLDIRQLWDVVPDEDRDITVTVDGELGEIKINNKKITFTPTSELSFAVLRAILPAEFRVNAKHFSRELRAMIIRLETYKELGDYKVIAINTTAESGLLLCNSGVSANDMITEVMHIDEIFENASDGNNATN